MTFHKSNSADFKLGITAGSINMIMLPLDRIGTTKYVSLWLGWVGFSVCWGRKIYDI